MTTTTDTGKNLTDEELRQARTALYYLRHHALHRTPFIPGPQDVSGVEALIERAVAAEKERGEWREAWQALKDASDVDSQIHTQLFTAEVSAKQAAERRAIAAEEALKAIISAAPRLPDSFRWTGTERAEDLFDAELRHECGKTPVDYLRAWLNMFRPFAYATRDDSWGELEKLICITMNNVVKTYAAIEEARALSSTEAQS